MPRKNKTPQDNNDNSNEFDFGNVPLDLEKQLEKIRKLVEAQNFETEDDVKKYLNEILNSDQKWPETGSESPLEQAQDLAYDAMDAPTRKESISLARQALQISPDCADAYVILAEEYATSLGEALHYYRAGVAAGERVLGKKLLKGGAHGDFWGDIQTRPYMRARAGLAECLWEMGKQNESINHYKALLKLNPRDNQGIRYVLAACLFKMGDFEALRKLLSRYHEASAAWLFTQALLVFKEKGDSPEANKELMRAVDYNRYVVPYLTGKKKLPRQLPDFVGFGDRREAVYYAAEFGAGWMEIEGAIDWLKKNTSVEDAKSQSRKAIKGIPDAFLKAFQTDDAEVKVSKKTEKIYTFKVNLKYAANLWRKIDIKGSQSLHHLHQAIVKAFERDDDHLYAFFMSNQAWDHSSEYGPPYGETDARNSQTTTIDSLNLTPQKKFLYIFDFGDEWQHPITLVSVRDEAPQGKYPRLVESRGQAPPQYENDEDGQ